MAKTIQDVVYEAMNVNEYKIVNNNIYHYTTPEGLLGILGKDGIKLHFTRCDCVNDISEGMDLIDVYSKACQEFLKEKEDYEYYNTIKDIKPSRDHFYINKKGNVPVLEFPKSSAYICCFSLEKDSLPMWNYYSSNGRYQGYNIMFSDHLFNSSKSILDLGYEVKLMKVIYNDKEKLTFWKSFINDLYEYRNEDKDFKNTINGIKIILTKLQFSYKKSCFFHEKEIRAIIKIDDVREDKKEYKPILTIEHKSNNGYVLPYVTVPLEYKSRLQGVTIGPLIAKDLSHSTISDLVKRRGYRVHDENIRNSEIPIRF